MTIMTGLSGNEIYCLHEKGYSPGNLVIGNSVFSLGFVGSLNSGLKTIGGGEIHEITELIREGREMAYMRMIEEARRHVGAGVTGVTNQLIFHDANIEYLSIGSAVHQDGSSNPDLPFSTSANGQELYCQLDCGFHPLKFVFGNVAYSIGLGGGLMGALRSLKSGEVHEFSGMLNNTRHLALQRIAHEAKEVGANAVVGIQTTIAPLIGVQEMVMTGTASYHPALPAEFKENPVTSDLTNEEMWNLAKMGYSPLRLVLGCSVFSVGLAGGVKAMFKSFTRGEIKELTYMIYHARLKALSIISEEAELYKADDVVGIKTYVYELGGGMVELLAIGTAIKKIPGMSVQSPNLIAQAIIRDTETFTNKAIFQSALARQSTVSVSSD